MILLYQSSFLFPTSFSDIFSQFIYLYILIEYLSKIKVNEFQEIDVKLILNKGERK